MQLYADRPTIDQEGIKWTTMNFDEFSNMFKEVNGDLVTVDNSKDSVIRRFYPSFSPSPNGKNYHIYCKYRLIRFKPWYDMEKIFLVCPVHQGYPPLYNIN